MWWALWVTVCCLGFFAIIGLTIWGIARAGEGRPGRGRLQEPMDIMRERLAKGEISRQDFERIKATLKN